MATNHYVYMLECKDGTLYTGYTVDLEERIKMHEAGKAAKYTRGRGPFRLVHIETYSTKREALQREYAIKRLPRAKKRELIEKGNRCDEDSE